jgi:hypothetical protein
MAAVTIASYNDLLAATADWLNRGDLVDQIPAFVTLTTAQFNRELRLRDMMVRADCTSSNELVALPSDWLEHYSLTQDPAQSTTLWPLQYMSEADSNVIKANAQGWIGAPLRGYTIIGNAIELVPAPADDVDLKMVYYARIPDLGPGLTQQTNWLLIKSPDLYLYSTCLQAAPYLKDDDRIASWGQIRAAIVETMRMESEAALRPRSGQLVARPKVHF